MSKTVHEEFDPWAASFFELDQTFWKHCGKGDSELIINHVRCAKRLGGISRSNSGKSSQHNVTIEVGVGEKNPRLVHRESEFSKNRRNDADRNWGLPE